MVKLKNKNEDKISWIISIFMILLAAAAWMILDRNWSSFNHLPVYVYAGVLIFYLQAEKFAYRGSDLSGVQSSKWTRYLLLFFWWLLLIVPTLEYSLFHRYSFAITAAGAVLTPNTAAKNSYTAPFLCYYSGRCSTDSIWNDPQVLGHIDSGKIFFCPHRDQGQP